VVDYPGASHSFCSRSIRPVSPAHKVGPHTSERPSRISIARLLLLALAGALLSGCAKDKLARNIYEGARVHNESLKSTPLENPRLESLSHDQYEKERHGDSRCQGNVSGDPQPSQASGNAPDSGVCSSSGH